MASTFFYIERFLKWQTTQHYFEAIYIDSIYITLMRKPSQIPLEQRFTQIKLSSIAFLLYKHHMNSVTLCRKMARNVELFPVYSWIWLRVEREIWLIFLCAISTFSQKHFSLLKDLVMDGWQVISVDRNSNRITEISYDKNCTKIYGTYRTY